MTTRDPIGRYAVEQRHDPGSDMLLDDAWPLDEDPPHTEQQQAALDKAAALTAGVTGVSTAEAHQQIDRFRRAYLATPVELRPVTPQDFAGGFRGRNPDTRPAPQDPATVWAHFRALHDPDAFPASTRLIASIDLETAGPEETWFDPAAGHILEVGIVTYRPDGTEQDRFTQLVRPPQDFLDVHGTGREEMHGISTEMLDGQPSWAEVQSAVGQRLQGSTLLAQNESYEKRWLGEHLTGFDGRAPSIDTVPLSRLVNRGLKNHKLGSICAHLGIPYADAHRATPDAEMAAQAFFTMRDNMQSLWRRDFADTSSVETPPVQTPETDARPDILRAV